MTKPNTPPRTSGETAAPLRREWSRPQVVEYGQLAKLTRVGSGKNDETGGKRKCL